MLLQGNSGSFAGRKCMFYKVKVVLSVTFLVPFAW